MSLDEVLKSVFSSTSNQGFTSAGILIGLLVLAIVLIKAGGKPPEGRG